MTEKQRKALVEFIKNPKNSKMTLGEAWNPRWGEPNIPSTRNDRSGRGNKCLEIDLSKIEDQLKGKLSEEHLDKLFSLEQDGKRIELQAEWSWYDEPSVNASGEDPEGSVEIVDEDNWRSYLMQEGFSEEEIDTLFETILDYYENAEDEDWEWETAYYDRKRERERYRREKANLQESKKFDYRRYLAEGWMFKEALDNNSQELQVGDSVMVKGRKGTYGPTKITGFAQGGDEQYVKISGIEVDGKFTTMVGEWQVEKV